jgi:serine/threonine protein kinase
MDRRDLRSIAIADFGLAVRMRGAKLAAKCGTPQYVAPEVLKVRLKYPFIGRDEG